MKIFGIFGILLLITILTACSSSQKAIEDDSFKNEYIFLDVNNDLVIYAIINRIVPIDGEVLKVEKITAEMSGYFEGKEVQSASILENIFSGNYPVSATEKMCTFVFKGKLSQRNISNININFYVQTNLGKFRKTLPKVTPNFSQIVDNMEFLKIVPIIEETDAKTLTFKALTIRQAPHQGAYRPSSEDFRVEIINSKEGKKWNSSEGMMYMQMIGSIEPLMVGTENLLTLQHKIDQKQFRLNGLNTVNFIIPAMPHQYQTSIKYWKR